MINQTNSSTKEYITSQFIVGTMRLGKWGVNMSSFEIEKFIEGCLENELLDFDHADIYGSYSTEADFGAVLKIRSDLRDKIRITTKCGIKMVSENRPKHEIKSYDLTKKHIKISVENSLKALQRDYIDTLLLHRPDFLIDPHDIADAFTELKKEGKVNHFGVSNFSTSQFDLLHTIFPLKTHQVEISLLNRERYLKMEFWINVKNLVSDPLDGHQWEVECFSKSQMMKEYWKYRENFDSL